MSKLYSVELVYKEIYEAKNEDDAIEKLRLEINNCVGGLDDNIEATEICPNCTDTIPLVVKIFDIDGTNLTEHIVCPNCGYGTPALR